MSTITLPNVRACSDITFRVRLKDNDVAVDWSGLTDIRALIYSEAQKAVAGRCAVEVDGEDGTLLVCTYAATKPQYLGINSIVIRCRYQGREKTYDKQAVNIVARTAQATGVLQISDPEVDVELVVEEVSTSLLDDAIAAAFDGADQANEAAARAEEAASVAAQDHVLAGEDHTRAESDHSRAESDHTRAAGDHNTFATDHERAEGDHSQAATDHQTAVSDHSAASSDHETAASDHNTAQSDHSQATGDHMVASQDHERAASDHTNAASDHDTAAADHAQAGRDHSVATGDHTTAQSDHSAAAADHTRAGEDHTQAGNDHTRAESDHSTAAADHSTASSDHTRAGSDHTRAEQDHTQAGTDHTNAAADHTRAGTDHTTAAADHTQAGEDHTLAAEDHSRAASDHETAVADHEAASSKAEKDADAVKGDVAVFDENGNPVDSGLHLSQVAQKDGYYGGLVAGRSENLIDAKGVGALQSFIRRQSGGGTAIADDGAGIIQEVRGKSLVWNQLLDENTAFDKNGGTLTQDGDVVTFTASGHGQQAYKYINSVISHKYASFVTFKKYSTDANVALRSFGTNTNGKATTDWQKVGVINTASTTSNSVGVIDNSVSDFDSIQIKNLMCIDLTLMFGAGNEPSTVEEFEAMFPKSYYPYTSGQIINLTTNALETVGFNQWDEEWEIGSINASTGEKEASNINIRSKNYIPVEPGSTYYVNIGSGDLLTKLRVRCYDAAKNYLGADITYTPRNENIVIASNCYYILFYAFQQYGTTYKGDICINLSDESRNGTYEPYRREIRALNVSRNLTPEPYDPNKTYAVDKGVLKDNKIYQCKTAILTPEAWDASKWNLVREAMVGEGCSAGSAYDSYTKTKGALRLGVVDLGSLNWTILSNYPYFLSTEKIGAAIPSATTVKANILCSKYIAIKNTAFNDGTDKSISINSNGYIGVYDSAYSNAATFKAAMSGVYLVYELATPIEFDLDGDWNNVYRVANDGTEEIVPTEDAQGNPTTTPLVAVIKYNQDFTQTIVNLPVNYSSKETVAAMLSAFQSAGIIASYTMTWNAEAGRYDFTITAPSNPE